MLRGSDAWVLIKSATTAIRRTRRGQLESAPQSPKRIGQRNGGKGMKTRIFPVSIPLPPFLCQKLRCSAAVAPSAPRRSLPTYGCARAPQASRLRVRGASRPESVRAARRRPNSQARTPAVPRPRPARPRVPRRYDGSMLRRCSARVLLTSAATRLIAATRIPPRGAPPPFRKLPQIQGDHRLGFPSVFPICGRLESAGTPRVSPAVRLSKSSRGKSRKHPPARQRSTAAAAA